MLVINKCDVTRGEKSKKGQKSDQTASNRLFTQTGATKSKSQTRLGGGLGKVLSLDLEITDGDSVLRHEAAEATGAVADLEGGTVLLECRRRRRVELGVQIASDRVAFRRRHPEVGATSVEDNLEVLRWRSDRDLREV